MSKTVPSEAFTRVIVSVCEFLEDWRKGDINLSTLAALDAQSIEEALTELGAAMDAAPSVEPDADLLEQVARAMCRARGRNPDDVAYGTGGTGVACSVAMRAWELEVVPARAAIAAMPGGGEWQPIETAPKDGSPFLALEGARHFDCWWHDAGCGEFYWMDEADSEPNPTHWMPLPPIRSALQGDGHD
jgi:hypothetical protein